MEVGDGNNITDAQGVQWLDMLSGILNVSLGHGSSVVANALAEVIMSGLVNTYDRHGENRRALVDLLHTYDGRFVWKLVNTGAEAVERAIQVVSENLGRLPRIAVLSRSFHGKSISMSSTRYDVPWGNPLNITVLDPQKDILPDFDMLFYEPIKGWDGNMPDEELLRQLCDKRGAYLVADEMITGFLRCGKRFLNKTADIVISGKGLAQGVPLAVLGIKAQHNPHKFTIGWNSTCAGNNLSATVGLRVLQYLISKETEIRTKVLKCEMELSSMGFTAQGALGFKRMVRPQSEMRFVFEQNRVVASWHDTFIRVGPSFITEQKELDKLRQVLKLAEND